MPTPDATGCLVESDAAFLYQLLLTIPQPRSIDTRIGQTAIMANKALPCTKAMHTSLLYDWNMDPQHISLYYPLLYSSNLISDQYILYINRKPDFPPLFIHRSRS